MVESRVYFNFIFGNIFNNINGKSYNSFTLLLKNNNTGLFNNYQMFINH